MPKIYGKGERAAQLLLRKIFPTAIIKDQIHVGSLFTKDLKKEMSPRQQKETVDIVVFRKEKKPLVIRIQDKRHRSRYMSKVDLAQQTYLEWSDCDVVDIPEWECPELFKDKVNSISEEELLKYIEPYL